MVKQEGLNLRDFMAETKSAILISNKNPNPIIHKTFRKPLTNYAQICSKNLIFIIQYSLLY